MNRDAYHELIDQIAGAAWEAAFGAGHPEAANETVPIDVVAVVEPLLSGLWPTVAALIGGDLHPDDAAVWRPAIRGRLLDEIEAALRHPDGADAAQRFYALVIFGVGHQLVTLAEIHATLDGMLDDDHRPSP